MKKIIVTLAMVSLAFASEKSAPPSGALVVTSQVKKEMINFTQTFSGTLYYTTKSKIASEMEGLVKSFSFEEGQVLQKGEVLASLDSQILKSNIMAKSATIKAMRADLTRQERELHRSKSLFEKNSISQSSYDLVFYTTQQIQAQIEAATNELNTMNIQMEKMQIKTPFDSMVVQRDVAVGQWLAKGATVATLVNLQSIEAKVNVPTDFLQYIHTYKTFLARAGDKEIPISLKNVIPIADQATRTFPLIFNVPKNMGFIEGMRIDIDIPILKETQSLFVPRDAVIKRFEQDVIFTIADSKAVMMPVKIIGYKTDMVAVSAEGLDEKMQVIVKGNERIFPNMPVIQKAHK